MAGVLASHGARIALVDQDEKIISTIRSEAAGIVNGD